MLHKESADPGSHSPDAPPSLVYVAKQSDSELLTVPLSP